MVLTEPSQVLAYDVSEFMQKNKKIVLRVDSLAPSEEEQLLIKFNYQMPNSSANFNFNLVGSDPKERKKREAKKERTK